MNNQSIQVKCSIVRGGTSKAVFILENELPKDLILREKIILALYGSPDIRQIDGLGGADLLTSKLAIIGPSTVPNADVDYTFGQVSITEPFVEFNSNCGNISSGVGPFAIDNGLVRATEPFTTVRIHLKNINKIMIAQVPTVEGKSAIDGDFEIDGVPGTGAKIYLDWSEVIGATMGKLLPTGNVKDVIVYNGRDYHISIVDAGTISVFVPAEELGMVGIESPQEIEANKDLQELIEIIRGKACELIGLVSNWENAIKETPYLPFLVTVAKPSDYTCFTGKKILEKEVDLVARLSSMGIINKTFAGSGTVCTGAAARIVGTVVHDVLNDESRKRSLLYIGHGAGRIPVEVEAQEENGSFSMKKINIYRTARILMDGCAYVRKSSLI
ncbi:MAG TPA: PrpF domain-containing protein [Tissierellaceae bacterium]|nr:PrpF domain-containing protein [Tissierellaceae bacterium]